MRPDLLRITLLSLLLSPALARAQACPAGAMAGSVGVGLYHCVGGACWISDVPALRKLDFSTEPRLRNVGGPAAGLLREGDVLIAVDGAPITVPAAGRRLGGLAPGDRVRLTIRRESQTLDVEIAAVAACSIGSLAVTADTSHPLLSRPPKPPGPPKLPGPPAGAGRALESGRIDHLRARSNPGSLGFTIECEACGWVADGRGGHRWQAQREPRLARIDSAGPAQRAGLRAGDILTHIDGKPVTSRDGSDALADVRAGGRYRLRVVRDGRSLTVEVRARPAGA